MVKSRAGSWVEGIAINVVSGIIALFPAALTTYFSHQGSTWVRPIVLGAASYFLTYAIYVAFRFAQSIPPPAEHITKENIDLHLRNWFLTFDLSVRVENNAMAYFSYSVNTPGGAKIIVSRSRDRFDDFLTVQALVTFSDDEKALIARMTDEEKVRGISRLKLELARFGVGYFTDNWLDGFKMVRQVAITHDLRGYKVIEAVWNMEAAINAIIATNVLTAIEFREAHRQEE